MLLSHIAGRGNPLPKGPPGKAAEYFRISGGGEGEFAVDGRVVPDVAVRTSGLAGHGTGAESLVNDGFDGARAAAAFGAAAEATINLLGIARKVFRGTDGKANIVVAEDVAGTNDHETEEPFGDAERSIVKMVARCKKKNPHF
jgi:hypothetical protein